MKCPSCQSESFVKNGRIHNGKQRFKCKICRRQFVENPTKKVISPELITISDKLLLEKISLAGISRSLGISETWLQKYVNKKYQNVSEKLTVTEKLKGKMTIECDEIWSFVGKKENEKQIWLAKDKNTKEIVGAFIGGHGREDARKLWDSLPPVYRQCAVSYTDLWSAYVGVFPKKRHRPVPKGSGKTNIIEGHNNAMRQRISRLVRKTASFSKKTKITEEQYLIFYIIIIRK
jgi:insertion element IS1 protein InsB